MIDYSPFRDTMNQLCPILDCPLSDGQKFSYTDDEAEMIKKQRN